MISNIIATSEAARNEWRFARDDGSMTNNGVDVVMALRGSVEVTDMYFGVNV